MPWAISMLILNALYQGFKMRYHLSQKFFGKIVKIKETSFLSIRGMTLMFGNCMLIEGSTYRIEGFILNPKKYVFPSIYLLFQIIDDLLYRIEGR